LLRDRVSGLIAIITDKDVSGKNVFQLNKIEEVSSFIEGRLKVA